MIVPNTKGNADSPYYKCECYRPSKNVVHVSEKAACEETEHKGYDENYEDDNWNMCWQPKEHEIDINSPQCARWGAF
jgi:hypothetical protein